MFVSHCPYALGGSGDLERALVSQPVTEGFKHRLGTGRFEYFYTNRLELCISEVADIAE